MRPLFLLLLFLLMIDTPTHAQTGAFRVMTWNIRFDNPSDGPDAWPLRRERVLGLIRFHAPDVFGIQEGLAAQVEYLKSELPEYTCVGVGRDDGKAGGEFSALFFRQDRFTATQSGTFWLSPSPEKPSKGWDAALNRICTYAVLADRQTGGRVFVFNTHFDHVGDTARLRSAQLLVSKMAELNPQGHPAVIMGDFNAAPGSPPIQTLASAWSDARVAGRTPPYGPEGTFNGFRPAAEPLGNRIDYVFVQQCSVQRYAALSDQWLGRYPSDHLPVLADLLAGHR